MTPRHDPRWGNANSYAPTPPESYRSLPASHSRQRCDHPTHQINKSINQIHEIHQVDATARAAEPARQSTTAHHSLSHALYLVHDRERRAAKQQLLNHERPGVVARLCQRRATALTAATSTTDQTAQKLTHRRASIRAHTRTNTRTTRTTE